MKSLCCCLAVLFLAHTAWPCANFTGGGTRYDGSEASSSRAYGAMRLKHAIAKNLNLDGKKLEEDLRGSTNFNDRSDYSIALMYLGRSKEAVAILEALEQERPGEYFIAANLGTAYELSKNNGKALQWITEGIRRNPDSHKGTEWLHVKILEAKIAQESDKAYFEKHSVLELEPGTIGEKYMVGTKGVPIGELAEAIVHQLGERLQFVKPPDAAVASLLFDYAAIEAATRSLEGAKKILEMAGDYGYPPVKIKPLLEEYNRKIAGRKLQNYIFYGLIGVSVVALLVLFYKRGIFVLSSRDLKHRS